MCWITLSGRGHALDGGQRCSAEVFRSFSPSGRALLAETALGLMAVMVSVRHQWLRRQHPTVSIPLPVTHTIGGFARDVARLFVLSGLTYSHIAHMEALLRADRFFGVSLLLLQQTEASFLAAFILAGSVATTFELFTHEWSRNPARVAAAQEACRLAIAANNARAAALGVFSSKTGLPDGVGMNIAGGHEKVKQAAADLDISTDEVVRVERANAGSFGGRATAGRNAPLATAASALVGCGVHNSKKGSHFLNNPDAVRLGAEIGVAVMLQVAWEGYITTSTTAMSVPEKPLSERVSIFLAKERCSRAGWEFLHATHSGSKWTLEDNITFTLPGHRDTEENPVLHVESMRKAISETYHILWRRHYIVELADKKDDDTGMKLNRNHNMGGRAKGGKYGEAGKG